MPGTLRDEGNEITSLSGTSPAPGAAPRQAPGAPDGSGDGILTHGAGPVATPGAPPEIRTAPTGAPTLVWDGHFLEDPDDPLEGARQMIAGALPDDAKEVVLFGAGLGYRVRWIVAAGYRPLVFEPLAEILRVAEAREPGIFEGAEVFDDASRLSAHLVGRSRAREKVVLVAPPAYTRAFPAHYATLRRSLAEADVLRTVRKNTAMARYRPQLEGALRNLDRLLDAPLAGAVGRPLAGRPAFIVAAGPSLDVNAHLLPELGRKGAVFVVSTAAPVLAAREQRFDALFSIETIDQSSSLAKGARYADALVADLACHPANLDVDVPRRAFFSVDHPGLSHLMHRLGDRGLSYGASVPTAAAVLAWHWGASAVVLIGQDLAYTGGRVYATGTGRERFRASVERGLVVVEHDEAFERGFLAAGMKAPTKARPAVPRRAWGGGEVITSHDLLLSAFWFESFARGLEGQIRLVNATEGGLHVEGFEHRPLADVLAELPDAETDLAGAIDAARCVSPADLDAVRRELLDEAREVARAARGCSTARTDKKRRRAEEALRRASKASPLVDMYAAPALTRLLEEEGLERAPAERERRVFDAIAESAERVVRLASAR